MTMSRPARPLREPSNLDRLLAEADRALRTVFAPAEAPDRASPGHAHPRIDLDEAQRRHVAGLMRINHAGEVCAQALYYGQAAVARDAGLRAHLVQSAREEGDHLAWCEARLHELGSHPSVLNPFWYAGAFSIGAGRSGTKAQKTRSQMSGTTKKFKKQKGGGARHGDYRAPIFVGGGRAFAASPRSFAQKVNRKMYRGAMQAILSELIRQDRVKVISALEVAAPKTKNFMAKLAELGVTSATFVAAEVSEASYLAARNIPHVHVVDVHGLNPASLVGTHNLVLTVDAVKKIEEWLS